MKIIKNSKYLSANYIPDKLPARDSLVNEIYQNLRISKCRMFLSGLTGTGKTASVQKAMEKLGKNYLLIYINCAESPNYSAMVQKMIKVIRKKNYSVAGKMRSELADYLGKMIKTNRTKHLVFIFDEVDKILNKKDNHQEIFFPLLNYGDVSFILISNDTSVLDKFDPRIYSRLSMDVKNIEPYSPNDTYHILLQRAKLALKMNSFNTNILIEISKHSSNMGDIRFALKCLEQSALVSEKLGKSKIDEEIIKLVVGGLETIEFENKFNSLSRQLKAVLSAICLESTKDNYGQAITYPNSFKIYVSICKDNKLFPVGERRFRFFLNQLEMMDFIILQNKSTNKQGGRVRTATPNFDFHKFVSERYRNVE